MKKQEASETSPKGSHDPRDPQKLGEQLFALRKKHPRKKFHKLADMLYEQR